MMEISDPQAWGFGFLVVSTIGVGAKWVGGIQNRTIRNEKDIALFNKTLEGHREISDKTNQAVGRIEGILEALNLRSKE